MPRNLTWYVFCGHLLFAGLAALAGLQTLEELVLHNCLRISGEGLRVSSRVAQTTSSAKQQEASVYVQITVCA